MGGEEKTSTTAFEEEITRGVSLLRGDPKTAIRKLSGPMIVAMLLLAVYNLADAIWVAGLGSDELAAVGFVMPVFMVLIGLSNGLGAGATSVVSRRIGARDKEGADSAASHAILIGLGIALLLTLPLTLNIRSIAEVLGAGSVAGLAAEYGSIVFLGTIFIFFVQISYAILRSEGDTTRTMYAMGASSVLNIVLDPILIYGAGMGVAGAAAATVISVATVSIVIFYWFNVKKDTYVTLSFRKLKPSRRVLSDILGVGLPASIEYLLMSLIVIINNIILVAVAGTDAVAVYTSGWRIVMFAVVPLIGIGTSLVAVAGAAYGSREYRKLEIAHRYSIRIGTGIAILTGIVTWIGAPWITMAFTYSPESAHLAAQFIIFFQTMCLFYPFVPAGMFSSSVFQGTGHGLTSLFITVLRNLLLIAVLAYLLGVVMGFGEIGVYFGIVAGNITGTLVGYIWARFFISRLIASEASI
ncbi:MAG TPA: MATE family efflux transporter [Methanoregulaceae archaeon]|mgnify:FL=1|jgi:putative MATE family efflux protein|nr:MATE family efflux transporter [Methanolinea sp.]HOP67259.1 MATE family efflux transporter [Methanoregulaceae archaeon]HPJ74480.1 MATE family efflux transporter [Methanoregulaceae archaeon]HPQ76069.1 MATE family efflux transporter [Methanoregulaceae archaeon]